MSISFVSGPDGDLLQSIRRTITFGDEILAAAIVRHPRDEEILLALVTMHGEAGGTATAILHAERLVETAARGPWREGSSRACSADRGEVMAGLTRREIEILAAGHSVPDRSGFEGLRTHLRDDVFGRLAWVGIVLAAASALVLVVGALVPDAKAPLGNIHPIGRVAMLVAGLGTAWLCKTARVSARGFTRFALGFEVVIAFGLGTQVLGWQDLVGAAGWPLGGAPAVGVWILIFAMLVPLRPREHMLGAVLSASSIPLYLALSSFARSPSAAPPAAPEALVVVQLMLPMAVAVGLAFVAAKLVYGLAQDLSEAQRMGSYRLQSILGKGGMGEVWRGEHALLARPAAIKLIRPDVAASEGAAVTEVLLQRFELEVQATAGLRSPHTIEVYDFGISNEGTFYYVMEMLDGLDLEQLVKEYGRQPVGRVVHILRQACHSLGEAHAAGLVHRDVKPPNIFICRYGRDVDHVKVLDFGLVRETKGEVDLTKVGSFAGTPAFAAPEQIMGKLDQLGPHSDVYALACVAYFLLTGRPVFDKKTVRDMLMAHIREEPQSVLELSKAPVPPELDGLLLACLEKSPADRVATMDEMDAGLAAIQVEHPWPADEARAWWEQERGAVPAAEESVG